MFVSLESPPIHSSLIRSSFCRLEFNFFRHFLNFHLRNFESSQSFVLASASLSRWKITYASQQNQVNFSEFYCYKFFHNSSSVQHDHLWAFSPGHVCHATDQLLYESVLPVRNDSQNNIFCKRPTHAVFVCIWWVVSAVSEARCHTRSF